MTKGIGWVGLKLRPTRMGDWKNTSGKVGNDVYEKPAEYFHGKKKDPNYKDRVALQELAAKVKMVEPVAEHGDVIAEVVGDSTPTA